MSGLVEKAAVSGAALASLMRECVSAPYAQEGFLLGNVTSEVTNHISDSQQDNHVTEVSINVSSTLPAPDAGVFYSPSGRIKEKVVREMLSEATPRVVGWYRYRRDGSVGPTVRDRVVSRGLRDLFRDRDTDRFLCCNLTCKRTGSDSTHVYSYRFSKVNADGELEALDDVTDNLGEKSFGYKRGVRADRRDPFDRIVRSAAETGASGVGAAIQRALAAAAAEAAGQEAAVRTVSSEICHMLGLLASYHRETASRQRLSKEADETCLAEEELIRPLREATEPSEAKSEPFDFVREMIRNDLKRNEGSRSCEPPDQVRETSPDRPKTTGHKRIHSEGGSASLENSDVDRNTFSGSRKSTMMHSNDDFK